MRSVRPFLPLVVIALLLAACAGSSATILSPGGGTADAGSGGTRLDSAPGAAPAVPAPAQGANGALAAARDDAKIVRTGSIALEVSDLAAAVRVARDAIVGLGGYVGASTTSNVADRPSAEITYRVPADRWERALDILRGLDGLTSKVVTERTEAVEVTGQVADLEARITNLRASETALQGIGEKATKITDVLEVQAQLTATRGQIEALTAQRKDLNDRSAYASLSVRFDVPIVAVEVASKGWAPTAVVDAAAATMVSVLQNIATAGIWFFIVWLPILLVLGTLILLVVAIARKFGVGRSAPRDMPPTLPVASEG